MPNKTPKNNVHNLIKIVDKDAIVKETPESKRSATKLLSAAPNPPGKNKADPKIDENEKIKTAVSKLIGEPNEYSKI